MHVANPTSGRSSRFRHSNQPPSRATDATIAIASYCSRLAEATTNSEIVFPTVCSTVTVARVATTPWLADNLWTNHPRHDYPGEITMPLLRLEPLVSVRITSDSYDAASTLCSTHVGACNTHVPMGNHTVMSSINRIVVCSVNYIAMSSIDSHCSRLLLTLIDWTSMNVGVMLVMIVTVLGSADKSRSTWATRRKGGSRTTRT